jgi:hypothetical protein
MLCALVFVVSAPTAFAAEAVPKALNVQMTPEEGDHMLFLESAEYAPNTPLPITVKFVMPKGATVSWAGEVFGGDPSKDIQAKPVVTPKKDYDEVSFTLTKARAAQLEADWHGLRKEKDKTVIVLPWIQAYPAEKVLFGFKAPTADSVVKMTPPWKHANVDSDKLRFYVTDPMELPVGKKLQVKISYTGKATGKAGEQAAAGADLTDKALLIFVALIAGGAIAATIWTQMRKQP